MADYSWRTVKKVTREYTIPTHEPWGAANAEIDKAWVAAMNDYRETHGLSDADAMADDALRWFARDDEIVISYIVEEGEEQ